MEQYTTIAYAHARSLTLHYSSSFGLSSRLFAREIQKHIYAIYGLVRIADEIVDTYKSTDATQLLNSLEEETYQSIHRHFSTNPIVHAFALTAREYGINRALIAPFFKSMRMDTETHIFDTKKYNDYIHGSAEVVGLMCLKVFCGGDNKNYKKLESGAEALGSAYQKVNFLRDLAEDYHELGRIYFPGITFEKFNDDSKQAIIHDIEKDFAHALPDIKRLPVSCRGAVETSYIYYSELLQKLKSTPAETIKKTRARIPTARKLQLFSKAAFKQSFHL